MMPFDIDGYDTHVRCNEMLAREAVEARRRGDIESADLFADILRARREQRAKYERGETRRMRVFFALIGIAAAGYAVASLARLAALFR